MSLLSLESAAADAGSAPAIVTRSSHLDYGEMLARTEPHGEGPLVLRATPSVSTLLAMHAAIRAGRALAPLHPAATALEEAQLHARLAALPTLATTSALAYISTSGTTGAPKLVELSRAAYEAHARASNAHLDLRADDRWLVALPLSHAGGLSIVLRCLAARAAVALDPAPPLGARWIDWLLSTTHELCVTRLSLVPSQLELLMRQQIVAPSGLRGALLGGQATPPAIAVQAVALGWPVILSYGLTETCGFCVATRLGDDLGTGAVGRPLDGVALRVLDDQLEIATAASASRVHGAPSPFTADGWLRTADRARLTDGVLTLLGRADDVIVSSGYKIDPLEIEAALAALAWHEGVAVLGLPDPRFGSIVAVILVTKLPSDAVTQRVEEALAALPSYKRPRRVHTVGALPRLASGKLDRAALRRMID